MERLKIQNLTFTYPEQENAVLRDVSMSLYPGDFAVLADDLSDISHRLGADGFNTFHIIDTMRNNAADHILRDHHGAVILNLSNILFVLSHGNTSII